MFRPISTAVTAMTNRSRAVGRTSLSQDSSSMTIKEYHSEGTESGKTINGDQTVFRI